MRKPVAVLMAATLILMAGCAQLPTSGSPREFSIEVPDREPLNQYGSGPQAGSTPEQLISDFLRASAAGSFDDYETAKRYLLPSAASTWQPTAQVTIFPTDHIPVPEMGEEESGDTARVTLTIPATATLGEDGFLHEFESKTEVPLRFRLAKFEGEWRIAALEDGIVLSQSSFTTGFSPFNVYFASADGQQLIPDPRWVPRFSDRVASHLAQSVLQGPPEILDGAVMNDLGEGLDLTAGAVEVLDGVAQVDLRGQAPTDPESRMLLKWELTETLKQSSTVKDVTVTVNGVNLDSPELPAGPQFVLDRMTWVDAGAIRVGLPSDSRITMDAERSGEGVAFPALGPLADSPVAWISDSKAVSRFSTSGGEVETVEVAGPSKLSIDRWGNIWTAADGNKGEVTVIPAAGEPITVSTGLSEQEVQQVAVSPDGARIAVLTVSGDVWIGTLVRAAEGEMAISRLATEERVTDPALSIAWAGSTTLLAIVRGSGDVPEARELKALPVGGFAQRTPAPDDVVWVSAGTGGGEWIAQRDDQVAFQRVGASWRPLVGTFEYIASPG